MDGRHLTQFLEGAASRRPDHPAVEDERGATLTYAGLLQGADRIATRLSRWGAGRGDRVGLWLPKCLEAVTAIHGILLAGASYVPADPTGPPARAAAILAAAGVKAAIVSADLAPALRDAWPGGGPLPRLILVGDESTHRHDDADWDDVMADDAPSPLAPPRAADDLAYILFTSGSTGQPKGVMLSHANALTFLNWCHEALRPWSDDDRFSSHAPLHFDLSIFDLFGACQHAATLVLIGESLGKDPGRLGGFLADRRISVWYSAPSILALRDGARRPGPTELPGAAAGALRRRGLPDRAVATAAGRLAESPDVEPLRPDRDQRLHGVSDPRADPRRSRRALPDRPGLPAALRPGGRPRRPLSARRLARRAGDRRAGRDARLFRPSRPG